jgi:hypothetical protein
LCPRSDLLNLAPFLTVIGQTAGNVARSELAPARNCCSLDSPAPAVSCCEFKFWREFCVGNELSCCGGGASVCQQIHFEGG